MHPTLMTMIADDRAASLRAAAPSQRRGTVIRAGTRRFRGLRRPRRTARVAHAEPAPRGEAFSTATVETPPRQARHVTVQG